MIEIIPAINSDNWETVRHRIELIAPYVEWVHLDVADGTFTKNITWTNPDDLKTLFVKHLRLEVHLMIREPEKSLKPWIDAGIRRAILHWETLKTKRLFGGSSREKIEEISKMLRENWVEFGLAIVYTTDEHEILPYLDLVDMVQVLAVEPGLAGQNFHPEALRKISNLRKAIEVRNLKIKIEADGGVSVSNIKDIYLSGANVVAAASAVFGAAEPHLALEALKRAILQ